MESSSEAEICDLDLNHGLGSILTRYDANGLDELLEAEVPSLGLLLRQRRKMQQDVRQFKVTVHHVVLLQVLEPIDNLSENDPGLWLGQAAAARLDEALEVAPVALLHH